MKERQSGNALFLILIAVALFAALSYAITQSSRGGGNTSKEKSTLNIAQAMSQIALVRATIQRMILTGTDPADLDFCTGGTECSVYAGTLCSTGDGTNCIFAAEGGGLSLSTLPDGYYITFFEPADGRIMDGHATTAPDAVILFTDTGNSLTLNECENINRQFGLTATPEEEATADLTYADGLSVSGKWDFCYDVDPTGSTNYVSFHVLQQF